MSEAVDRVAKEVMVELHKTIGLDMTLGLARNIARSAIEAMREPTDAMRLVGADVAGNSKDGAGVIWQAMIDAALRK